MCVMRGEKKCKKCVHAKKMQYLGNAAASVDCCCSPTKGGRIQPKEGHGWVGHPHLDSDFPKNVHPKNRPKIKLWALMEQKNALCGRSGPHGRQGGGATLRRRGPPQGSPSFEPSQPPGFARWRGKGYIKTCAMVFFCQWLLFKTTGGDSPNNPGWRRTYKGGPLTKSHHLKTSPKIFW